MRLKEYFILVFAVCVTCIQVVGQTVSIPDPGFKACLLEDYPSTMDAGQNLVIAQAESVTGSLNCENRDIENVEGIQHFKNVTEIILAENKLTFIPQISSLNNLKILQLQDNQLAELPSFTFLTSLNRLDVRRNRLKTLPDFSNNSSLQYINAHTNQIDSLPNLEALVNLTYLNVAINDLSALPNLNNLTSLKELMCWRNNLTKLPDLSNLTNLTFIDATSNDIIEYPTLAQGGSIETIHLERNNIDSLPDFTVFPNLIKARVYDNFLTFEDLVPLTSIPEYNTIFPASPQRKIRIGRTYKVLETEVFSLQTGIDKNVDGVNYEWIYNGQTMGNSSVDAVRAFTESVAKSGFYYCKITHPAFPDLVLETDSIYVDVLSCINLAGFSTVVTSTTCLQAGSLVIIAANQPMQNLTYEIKSTGSGKVFKSSKGVFTDLNEPEYLLSIKAGNNCVKEFPDKINIPVQVCEDVFITPNGDGVDDNYFFTESGTAMIFDKWGNKIKTFSIPGSWDGTGNAGTVSPGIYIVNINDGESVVKLSVVY